MSAAHRRPAQLLPGRCLSRGLAATRTTHRSRIQAARPGATEAIYILSRCSIKPFSSPNARSILRRTHAREREEEKKGNEATTGGQANCLMQQPEQAMPVFFPVCLCLAFALPWAETRSRSLGDAQFSLENPPRPTPRTLALSHICLCFSHTIHAGSGSPRFPRLPCPCIWPGKNPHHYRNRRAEPAQKVKLLPFMCYLTCWNWELLLF